VHSLVRAVLRVGDYRFSHPRRLRGNSNYTRVMPKAYPDLPESKDERAPERPADDGPAVADPLTMERLFREHNAALLRFVAVRLGSEQEAKEVAQEAYVRLLRLHHPETISYLRAFLFKTAANLAVDRLRARGRCPPTRPMHDMELAVFHLSPDRQIEGEESVAILDRALAELPHKCREAFLLHRLQGMSRQEIGVRLGIGERMVRLYLARALEHLRFRLDTEIRS
jgi:RNA polymerase sigma factor (sigma-70 family)